MESSGQKFSAKFLYVIHRLIEYFGRWFFLLSSYLGGPPECVPELENVDITMSPSTTLATMVRLRKLKAETVVKAFIDRIKTIQPIVNCIVEDRFDEALKEARECDKLLASPDAPTNDVLEKEKPFFGVPFTTKDCIGVRGMKQTAGLVSRKNTLTEKEAEAISLMRNAGAIPLATTNISELAMWWETHNYVYGRTKNPYNTWHIVGGSSGGEGCIQAAAGAPMGIGSDIGGSIRMPSFFNGIFGHKPSKGIVSNHGQYPCTHTPQQNELLAIGPMCRYATDLKPILKVIAGKNVSKLKLDDKVDISKLKFYYMEDDGGQIGVSPVSKDIKEAMHKAIDYLSYAHKIKIEKVQIRKLKKSLALWFANMTSPEGKDFGYELTNRTGHINIFSEFFKWLTRTGAHTLVALLTTCTESLGPKYNSEKRAKLLEQSQHLRDEFADMLGEDGVFLYPTHPTPAPLHHEPLLKPFNFSYTAIINLLGLPATACPMGFSNGLPIGFQVVSGLYQDHLTLAVAEELERGFGGWTPPNSGINEGNPEAKLKNQ